MRIILNVTVIALSTFVQGNVLTMLTPFLDVKLLKLNFL